jgi:predicted 3-demethylubiquinone-9 3-methyltransferase (glyoxalase superfamily)
MPHDRIVPCLWFDDAAEQAAEFYVATFPESRMGAVARYPEATRNPSGKPPGSVMTVDFTVAGRRFTALNGGPGYTINPSISFFVLVPTPADVDALWAVLSEDGEVAMPLDAYEWSERYGWIQDRFGVSWQVMAEPGTVRTTIVPCLMFSDAQRNRAGEAIEHYRRAFADSSIELMDTYDRSEVPAATVKHARIALDGQPMALMDSPIDHGFTFNEAVSLQLMCADQGEVDHFWTALSDGGAEGPCGWLKDPFGVSWQVVPEAVSEWMTHPDPVARARAFEAMLGMGKLDVAALERALGATTG